MEIRFNHRVVLITGAGSGIGFACSQIMAESGATVAMVGKKKEKIDAAANALNKCGRVQAYSQDITQVSEIPSLIQKIRSDLGEVHYLIQSAGLLNTHTKACSAEKAWDITLDTNAKGLSFMMQAVVNQSMKPIGTGAIVNIASMAGIRGMVPPLGSPHYTASKGAVVALTRFGAVHWGPFGIRVNALAPAGVASIGYGITDKASVSPNDPTLPFLDIIPTRRHSTTEEIAAMACFLCADVSANTTGQIIAIDGGVSALGF